MYMYNAHCMGSTLPKITHCIQIIQCGQRTRYLMNTE